MRELEGFDRLRREVERSARKTRRMVESAERIGALDLATDAINGIAGPGSGLARLASDYSSAADRIAAQFKGAERVATHFTSASDRVAEQFKRADHIAAQLTAADRVAEQFRSVERLAASHGLRDAATQYVDPMSDYTDPLSQYAPTPDRSPGDFNFEVPVHPGHETNAKLEILGQVMGEVLDQARIETRRADEQAAQQRHASKWEWVRWGVQVTLSLAVLGLLVYVNFLRAAG